MDTTRGIGHPTFWPRQCPEVSKTAVKCESWKSSQPRAPSYTTLFVELVGMIDAAGRTQSVSTSRQAFVESPALGVAERCGSPVGSPIRLPQDHEPQPIRMTGGRVCRAPPMGPTLAFKRPVRDAEARGRLRSALRGVSGPRASNLWLSEHDVPRVFLNIAKFCPRASVRVNLLT